MITAQDLPELQAAALAFVDSLRTPGLPLGHFRWCSADRHPWSLYAANSALAIYNASGRTATLTAAERQGWARVFLDHYHAELGLFICPQLYGSSEFRGDPTDPDARRLADATAPYKKVAAKLYDLIGEIPPTPDEGTLGCETTAELADYFARERARQHPYSYGSTIGNFMHLRTLWLCGQGRSVDGDPWIEWGYSVIADTLDAETGMVASGRDNTPVMQMNGLFKLSCSSFWNHSRPVPRARRIVDTLMGMIDADGGFGDNCEDYNAVSMLARLARQEDGYRSADILAVLEQPILARLDRRRRADGGFSAHPDHCLTQINGYPISPPLPIGDLQGTGQQLTILRYLQDLHEQATGAP